MSDNNPSLLDELRSSLTSFQQLRHSAVTSIILMLIGVAIIVGSFIYSVTRLRPLERQIKEKEARVEELDRTIDALDKKKNELNEQLDYFYEAANLSGKRRQALLLTLALQNKNIPFTMGGRSPETGFDLSGFILYILSRPEIGIIKQSDVPYCNQPCLMLKTKAINASTIPPDLKPGDLIFYDYNSTMMYLGNNKCRGMIYEGKIETKDVDFWPIIGYSKMPYGD